MKGMRLIRTILPIALSEPNRYEATVWPRTTTLADASTSSGVK